MDAAAAAMNDYRRIRLARNGYRKIRPLDTVQWHLQDRTWLQDKLNESFDGPHGRCDAYGTGWAVHTGSIQRSAPLSCFRLRPGVDDREVTSVDPLSHSRLSGLQSRRNESGVQPIGIARAGLGRRVALGESAF